MAFEYDAKKSAQNEQKHGVSFAEAINLWDTTHVIVPAKHVAGESRFAILGKLAGKMTVAIYTLRGEAIRIISCHRADKKLERIYEKLIKEKQG
ncbi:MAG: hypothetical protein ACD_62C00120G0004 [uncultured bacterium]|nr:MAG: hypothetical protein ACD_62C00120G0004 [uncultured bacterium]HLD45168.1 BrnT family toxin [bacterium]